MRKKIYLYIIYIFLYSLSLLDCENLSAFQSVIINDTIITHGKTYLIPVRGSIQILNQTEIKLVLKYNGHALNIITVLGDSNYSIRCSNPILNNDLSDIQNARIEIICRDSIKSINNGIICFLEVEALQSSDTTAYIQPTELYLDSQLETEIQLETSNIKVAGELIYDKLFEGLGYNFPNPFDNKSEFKFSLDKPTSVKFTVYSYLGRYVEYKNINKKNISIYKESKPVDIEIEDVESILERGRYLLSFHPDFWEFSSGLYFLIMKTQNGTYSTTFIIHK